MIKPEDLKIGALYGVYKDFRATYECLKSFRQFYPEAPVRLVGNNNFDLQKIADYFHCDYVYNPVQLVSETKPYRFESLSKLMVFLDTVREGCYSLPNVDWILFMEDDMRTRGRIKHLPPAPMAGPCTCQFTPGLEDFIKTKYPWIDIWGYSGCAGTIMHREILLKCLNNLPDFEEAALLDERVKYYSDALITYLFLYNGYENKRWLDQSETSCDRGRPDAAFDHQFKDFYGMHWDYSMIGS